MLQPIVSVVVFIFLRETKMWQKHAAKVAQVKNKR